MKFAAYDDISIYGLDYARTPDIYTFTRSGICARGALRTTSGDATETAAQGMKTIAEFMRTER